MNFEDLKSWNIDDLLAETEDDFSDAPSELNIDVIKNNMPIYTTQKLAEMVVCSRYFGFDSQITTMCMEELAKRREAGDTFPFETFIEDSYNKLPQLSIGIPDLRTILGQLSKNHGVK